MMCAQCIAIRICVSVSSGDECKGTISAAGECETPRSQTAAVTQRLTLVFTPSSMGNTGNLHPAPTPPPLPPFPSPELLSYSAAQLSWAPAVAASSGL